MKKLKYLVVGSGRCGTVFYARLLTSLGFPCGHESFFNYQDIEAALVRLSGRSKPNLSQCSQLVFDGRTLQAIDPYIVDLETLVADSSYMAVPCLHHECLKDTQVIHVVRHPVKVVNSFVHYLRYFYDPPICIPPNPIYEAFISRHVPELKSYSSPYERAALYYVLWNEMIETREVVARFKAEDGPEPLKRLLGVTALGHFDDRKVNTYECPGDRFDLNLLPNGDIKDKFVYMGERYGYTMVSEYLLM